MKYCIPILRAGWRCQGLTTSKMLLSVGYFIFMFFHQDILLMSLGGSMPESHWTRFTCWLSNCKLCLGFCLESLCSVIITDPFSCIFWQIVPMRWINWFVYLWILLVLLPCPFRYVWVHANHFLLWIHGLHLLWLLSHAWNCRLSCGLTLCSSHIPVYQVWVITWSNSKVGG